MPLFSDEKETLKADIHEAHFHYSSEGLLSKQTPDVSLYAGPSRSEVIGARSKHGRAEWSCDYHSQQ